MSRCFVCGKGTEGDCDYHESCARKLFGSAEVPSFTYSQEELNRLARNLIEARMSVPGVQAKLSVHLERASEGSRLTLVGLEGNYILKLPTSQYAELPEAEHFCMNLARHCGFETAAFGLVRLASGKFAYLTRRLDREDGVKHMIDMCQLAEKQTERKYYGSYELIGRIIRRYSAFGGADITTLFDLVVFSFLTGNSDMHLKNFSLLREHDGAWHLAPAYDLVPVRLVLPADEDDLAITLNGKNRKLRPGDFKIFAETIGLSKAQYERSMTRIVTRVERELPIALEESFLSETFKARMRDFVRGSLARISSS